MKYVLYNPLSGKSESEDVAMKIVNLTPDTAVAVNMLEIVSYADFFGAVGEGDEIVICGGDGTINKFVNDTDGVEIPCEIYYMPTGTGNDFATDVGFGNTTEPFLLTPYLRNLPTVTVNGKTLKFINGVGFGIDGYCCEIGDKMKSESKQPNYTMIAIKGLLFSYEPCGATVTVDGEEYRYEKVWIAPTMHGRRYGGGMIPTPEQERGSGELSLMVFHDSSKLKTLMIFPGIFKGEHVKEEKYVTVFKGKEITVKFDEPKALQIDGETVLGVTEYTARV